MAPSVPPVAPVGPRPMPAWKQPAATTSSAATEPAGGSVSTLSDRIIAARMSLRSSAKPHRPALPPWVVEELGVTPSPNTGELAADVTAEATGMAAATDQSDPPPAGQQTSVLTGPRAPRFPVRRNPATTAFTDSPTAGSTTSLSSNPESEPGQQYPVVAAFSAPTSAPESTIGVSSGSDFTPIAPDAILAAAARRPASQVMKMPTPWDSDEWTSAGILPSMRTDSRVYGEAHYYDLPPDVAASLSYGVPPMPPHDDDDDSSMSFPAGTVVGGIPLFGVRLAQEPPPPAPNAAAAVFTPFPQTSTKPMTAPVAPSASHSSHATPPRSTIVSPQRIPTRQDTAISSASSAAASFKMPASVVLAASPSSTPSASSYPEKPPSEVPGFPPGTKLSFGAGDLAEEPDEDEDEDEEQTPPPTSNRTTPSVTSAPSATSIPINKRSGISPAQSFASVPVKKPSVYAPVQVPASSPPPPAPALPPRPSVSNSQAPIANTYSTPSQTTKLATVASASPPAATTPAASAHSSNRLSSAYSVVSGAAKVAGIAGAVVGSVAAHALASKPQKQPQQQATAQAVSSSVTSAKPQQQPLHAAASVAAQPHRRLSDSRPQQPTTASTNNAVPTKKPSSATPTSEAAKMSAVLRPPSMLSATQHGSTTSTIASEARFKKSGQQASATLNTDPAALARYLDNARKSKDVRVQREFAKYLLATAKRPDPPKAAEFGRNAAELISAQIALETQRKDLLKEAEYWIETLAKNGDSEACFIKGLWFENGELGKSVNKSTAFEWFLAGSKGDYAPASWKVALYYESKGDVSKALEYYKRASNMNDPAANYRLGKAVLLGELRLQKSTKDALKYLRKAAASPTSEHPEGAFLLAQLLAGTHPTFQLPKSDRDAKTGLKLFSKCAELAYAPAQVELARCYEHGLLGCPTDPKYSVTWYRRAAEANSDEAALALSSWCARGAPGVFSKDERAAFEWCKKAVELGNPLAEYVFGYYHENGIGVKLDKNVAFLWYRKSAKSGNEMAKRRLADLDVQRQPSAPPRPTGGRVPVMYGYQAAKRPAYQRKASDDGCTHQ